MIQLNTFLSSEIVQRIGWTLINLLWQGLTVAIITAIVLGAMKKASATARYWVACFGLALMVGVAIATFIFVPVEAPTPFTATNDNPVISQPETISNQPAVHVVIKQPIESAPAAQTPFWETALAKLEHTLPWIVVSWFIGVCILSFWYLGSWYQLQKLRRIGCKSINDQIAEKCAAIASQMGITQSVRIVESVLVQVPTVIGWLKPVIMLPASAITGLDPVQLNALIAHEMAHIKRCDYLINLLQVVIEILGFYHPAVWWLSRQIRIEREHCCDDLAVNVLQNRKEYAKALFNMDQIRSNQLNLAVAANGGDLLGRIGRLAGKQSPQRQNRGRLASIITVLLIMVVFSVSCSLSSEYTKSQESNTENALEILNVKIEPIAQGINTIYTSVKNTTDTEQLFAIHIYTRSVDYGPQGVGWGTGFFESLGPNETKRVRSVYKIQGPVTENTYIQLRFYNPESRQAYDYDKPFAQQRYQSSELEKAETSTDLKPASEEQFNEISRVLKSAQVYISQKQYENAWNLFSDDYRNAEYQNHGIEKFRQQMEPEHPLHSAFVWEKDDFLKLNPVTAYEKGSTLQLQALCGNTTWTIDFIQQQDTWKINWIAGYTPKVIDMQKADQNKNTQEETSDKKQQILTSSYILTVPADFPQLTDLLSTDNLNPRTITNDQLDAFLNSVRTSPDARLLSAPKILTSDAQPGKLEISNPDGTQSTKLNIQNNIKPDGKTITLQIEFEQTTKSDEMASAESLATTATVLTDHAIVITGQTVNNMMTLILVKPQILDSKSTGDSPTAIGQLAMAGGMMAGMGGGMSGGMGGGMSGGLGGGMSAGIGGVSPAPANTDGRTSTGTNQVIVPTSINSNGASIQIENPVHDFGDIKPGTSHDCEFKFKNVGTGDLKILNIQATCGCTAPMKPDKQTYAPGESGSFTVHFKAPQDKVKIKKHLYIKSNDPQNPSAQLEIRANIIDKLQTTPKYIELRLDQDNAGMDEITIASEDNQPFLITEIITKNTAITVPFDPAEKSKQFTLKPKVDLEQLEQSPIGVIQIKTDHPDGGTQLIRYEALPYFTVTRPRIILQNMEPGKSYIEKAQIHSHYGKIIRIQSAKSRNGLMKIISQTQSTNLMELEIEITPVQSERRYITDELTIILEDGYELSIRCSGWFAKDSMPNTTGNKTDAVISLIDKPDQPYSSEITYPRNWDEIVKKRQQAHPQEAVSTTPQSTDPNQYSTKIFDFSDLLIRPAMYDTEKPTSSHDDFIEQEKLKLKQTIIQSITPESWFDNGGQGRIDIYGQAKLLIWQTPAMHEEIGQFLNALREESSRQVAIEARFLLVDDRFQEDIGLDDSFQIAGQVFEGPANDNKIMELLNTKPGLIPVDSPLQQLRTIDEKQSNLLIRATQAHRNTRTLTAPKAMVLNDESACMEVFKSVPYLDIADRQTNTKHGVRLDIKPSILNNDTEVLLKGNILLSEVLKNQIQMHEGKNYEIPYLQVFTLPIHAQVKDQETILITGPELKVAQDDKVFDEEETVRILVMLKPTIIIPKEQPIPPQQMQKTGTTFGGGYGIAPIQWEESNTGK